MIHDDPRAVAKKIRERIHRITPALDVIGDQGPAAFRYAADWAATIPASGNGPGGIGHISDPTGNGTSRDAKAWMSMIDDLITIEAAAKRLETAALNLAFRIARHVPATPTSRQEANDLDALNRGAGECETCRHVTPSGIGDDRLRTIPVADRERIEMCNGCRLAWSRRYQTTTPPVTYDDFADSRRQRARRNP